jgi:hypothetical protein
MVLGEDWREAFIDFIRDQRLPAGIDARSAEAARVLRRSKGFVLVDGKLYRRGARSGVLMKCVTKEDGLTPDRVVNFISDILHRFSFPNTIITDLGSNFTANQFWKFCENACIEVKYISVAHPRANGQVERANGLIIDGLKKRRYDETSKKGGKWVHELPHVVWGLRTKPSQAIGQTPFFLVYGSEAILPADIMWKSPRVEMFNEGEADEARQLELHSVEEGRCTALVQSARYLQGIRRYHDCSVRERSFSIGDLVLRRIQDESGLHKLNSRWEGPFVVKQVTRPGSYRLQYPEGQDVPNSWNIQNLRNFYP